MDAIQFPDFLSKSGLSMDLRLVGYPLSASVDMKVNIFMVSILSWRTVAKFHSPSCLQKRKDMILFHTVISSR